MYNVCRRNVCALRVLCVPLVLFFLSRVRSTSMLCLSPIPTLQSTGPDQSLPASSATDILTFPHPSSTHLTYQLVYFSLSVYSISIPVHAFVLPLLCLFFTSLPVHIASCWALPSPTQVTLTLLTWCRRLFHPLLSRPPTGTPIPRYPVHRMSVHR